MCIFTSNVQDIQSQMKKEIVILFLIVFFKYGVYSQVDSVYYGAPPQKQKVKEKEKPNINIKDKLSFGGNFMVWFGSSTYLYLSPTVNYSATKRINLGLGIIYNYIANNYQNSRYEYSIYGLHTYALAFLTKNLFAKVEFNHLNQPNVYSYNLNDKLWVSYLFAGGGYRQAIGDHAAFYTSVMWNINKGPQTVLYPSPMIQIGILAGF